jgi:hypothetical protein
MVARWMPAPTLRGSELQIKAIIKSKRKGSLVQGVARGCLGVVTPSVFVRKSA